MREIKFRGFDKENKTWRYGHYTILQQGIRYYDAIICPNEDGDLIRYYIFDKKTIGQYIGFKDKNGKEIYEGDYNIDSKFNILSLIVFYEGAFKYADYELLDDSTYKFIKYKNIDQYFYNKMDFSKNIYENPELLEGV